MSEGQVAKVLWRLRNDEDARRAPCGKWKVLTPPGLTRDMLGTGTEAAQSIRPPGWSGNGTLYNESRGHLLANRLGGSGDIAENLVTLQQFPANSPVMSGFEAQVASAVRAGETVKYASTPIYNGSNLIPRGITITARGSGGFSLDVSVLNPIGR